MGRLKSIIAVAALAGAAALIGTLAWRHYAMPFVGVELPDTLTAAEAQAVRRVVERARAGARASVRELAGRLEAVEWVRAATVRRIWPSAIRIDLTLDAPAPPGVSALAGNDRAQRVYALLSPWITDAGLTIGALEETRIGGWRVTLGNGVAIVLGDDDLGGRLGRALAVYQIKLIGRMDEVVGMDARYGGGVAVRWRDEAAAAPVMLARQH